MTEALHNILLLVKKPVETFNELKYRRYRHWGLIALTLAAWLIVDIMVKQLYGFRFNTNHADELNILIELSMTIGLFFLFCISNKSDNFLSRHFLCSHEILHSFQLKVSILYHKPKEMNT